MQTATVTDCGLRSRRMAIIGLGILSAGMVRAGPSYDFRRIASVGDEIPPGGVGHMVFDFEPYSINNLGDVGCGIDIEGGGEGVMLFARNAAPRLLSRFNDPERCGGVFGQVFLGVISINDAGQMAFVHQVQIPGNDLSSGLYLFSRDTGTTRCLISPGDSAPGGGTFTGFSFHPMISQEGDIVVAGFIEGRPPAIPDPPGPAGVTTGIFRRHADGTVEELVKVGDPAPGGKAFDFVTNQWINKGGDLGFGAHVQGDHCIDQGAFIWCAVGVFLKKASGEVVPIAPRGGDAPVPGGGKYRLAFGPILNDSGDLAFTGDLTDDPDPNAIGQKLAVFLFKDGAVMPIAIPGDPMPNGGTFVTTGFFVGNVHLNQRGEVTFNATVDTGRDPPAGTGKDVDGDGTPDLLEQGLFVWSRGTIHEVVRTGMDIPDLGKTAALLPPDLIAQFPADWPYPWVGAATNEKGEIAFMVAAQKDGGEIEGHLVIAAPREPILTLTDGEGAGTHEIHLTTREPFQAFSFHLSLQGNCAGAAILSLAAAEGLPAGAESIQGTVAPDGKSASFSVVYAPGEAPFPGPADRWRIARVEVTPGTEIGHCELRFSPPAGEPPAPNVVKTGAGQELEPRDNAITVHPRELTPASRFRRADADGNGVVNLTDPIFLLDSLFRGGPAPTCLDAADADDTGIVDLTDAISSLNFQFLSGPSPPLPGSSECGEDPGDDALDCQEYGACG